MNVGKFSVNNTVLVNIMIVSIVVMGIFSLNRLPREMMSDINFSWVLMVVFHPGVSAEEMEKNVTIKVENEISDVDRIKKITSTTWEGKSVIFAQFEDDLSKSEFARHYQDLRAEFDKVELPKDALEPYIDDFSSSDMWPVIAVILRGESDDITVNRVMRNLQEKIQDVDHVSQAGIMGGKEREIWVEVDRNKIEALGLPLDEIANAIKYRNTNIPGGTLESQSSDYVLQTIGELKNIKDFENIIIRSRPGKGLVKVRDVATVNTGLGKSQYDARFNGEKAIYIWVTKSLKGNSIQVVDEVKKAVEDFKKTLPRGMTIEYLTDTTIQIRDIIKTLSSNSVLGFFFVVIALLFFLGFRNSLITAMGIPLTFAITFIFMDIYGESLNGNSLFALVLVLGMIVDHAIVIMENSYRHRQMGLSARESAIVGTNEVVKPVIAGTLTTVAAFLPLMILPGIMGKFMRIIPIVVSLALVASTFEALFFLPVHFADWGSKAKRAERGFVVKLQSIFRKILQRLYAHRYLTAFSTIIAIIAAITLAFTPLVKQDLFAGEDIPQFYIDISLPLGTSRDVTDKVTRRFEEKILPLVGNGEIKGVLTTVGFIMGDEEWLTLSHVAEITVDVVERNEGRERPIVEIMEDVKKLCAGIPGADQVIYRKVNTGPPVDKPVTFRLLGENFDDLSSIAGDYKKMLSEYKELYNISDNFDRGRPEFRIVINEERAAELGLNVGYIGMTVRNSFEGIEATKFYDEDEEIDVIVKFAEKYKVSIEDIRQLKIPTPDGRLIPLSTVARIEPGKSIANIKRADKKREITVSADTESKNKKILVDEINARVQSMFDEKYKQAYPEISLKLGGEFEEFNKLLVDIVRLLGVGLFLMYIILGAQFNSFLQPFIIVFTVPFAVIGCILFLATTGTPVSITVIFAGVALVGISVNDSIVLISFINTMRRKGSDITEAVIEGSVVRLRPIILTSFTTIGGLLPMAIGLGGKSEAWGPMAATVIFGLFFSTVGTLVVIPCIYGILGDILGLFGVKMQMKGE